METRNHTTTTTARTTLTLFIPDKTTVEKPRESPDSAFQTGSEFNDSFDQNSSSSALNDKVERWVRSSSIENSAHAQPRLSSDDFEEIASTVSSSTQIKIRPDVPNGKIIIEEHVEEILQMDSSYSCSTTPEPLAAENFTSISSEEDIPYDVTDLPGPLSWECNWLFKKKKFRQTQNSHQFRTIMFIPNPSNYSESQYSSWEGEELEENEDLSLDPAPFDSDESEDEEQVFYTKDTSFGGFRTSVHDKLPVVFSSKSSDETLRETSQSLVTNPETIEIVPAAAAVPPPIAPKQAPVPANDALDFNKCSSTTSPTIENSTNPRTTPDPLTTMRIAEREKQKWNNPVSLSNNPYTPENLLRRMRNNSFLSGGMGVAQICSSGLECPEDPQDGACQTRRNVIQADERIRRDYYVNTDEDPLQAKPCSQPASSSVPGSKVKHCSTRSPGELTTPPLRLDVRSSTSTENLRTETRSGLDRFKSPSVKDLTLQFTKLDECPVYAVKTRAVDSRPIKVKPAMVRKEIHSLTARSVPRQFREGLRLAKSPMANSNIKTQ